MPSRPLPKYLFAAYNWTEAAGELDELRALCGKALETYIRESAANARENDMPDIDAGDLYELHLWLREEL